MCEQLGHCVRVCACVCTPGSVVLMTVTMTIMQRSGVSTHTSGYVGGHLTCRSTVT